MAQVNTYLKNFVKCTSSQYEDLKNNGQLEANKIYLKTAQSTILDRVYPVGTIYTSLVDVSPASFLGGSWEKITDNMFMRSATTGVHNDIKKDGGRDDKVILSHEHSINHNHDEHTHKLTGSGSTTTDGEHAHAWLAADTNLGGVADSMYKPSGSGNYRFDSGVARTGSGGVHGHKIEFTLHNNPVQLTYSGQTGSGSKDSATSTNLPVYKNAYMWVRVPS